MYHGGPLEQGCITGQPRLLLPLPFPQSCAGERPVSCGVSREGLCHWVSPWGEPHAATWVCCAKLRPHPHFSPSRKQVLGTKVDAERDGVKVPTTLAEYCVKTKTPAPDEGSDLFYDDYYEDDEMEEEADSCYGDEDDSGNEES